MDSSEQYNPRRGSTKADPTLFGSPSSSSTTDASLADNAEYLHAKNADDINQTSSGSEYPENHLDDEDMGPTATRMTSTVSIAEQLPLWRELLFVTVICLAQLFTREWHSQLP